MASKISAGMLPYRFSAGVLEVFLVHPGGPFWTKRDLGAWSIAKGEVEQGEATLHAALREFREETGFAIDGAFIELAPARQPGGKLVHAWAVAADLDAARIVSNTFAIEWPPHSGAQRQFPEVDRARWFAIAQALEHVLRGQRGLIEELQRRIGTPPAASPE